MRALRHLGWGLVCVLAVASTAAAQQNASISGIVTDMTGGVLPGVIVEATSPVLIEKVRTAVSEANGRYQLQELQPGAYRVTFTLPGFSTVRREGIVLTAGFAASINVELSTGTLTETITVTGASPVVDVRNVAQTQVLTRDVLDSTPNARVIGSLMTLVPGVTITTACGRRRHSRLHVCRGADSRQQPVRPDDRDLRHPDDTHRQHRQVAHQPS